jgi:hypothetical protein
MSQDSSRAVDPQHVTCSAQESLRSPYLMLASKQLETIESVIRDSVTQIESDIKGAVDSLVRGIKEIRRAGIDNIFETRERALEMFLPSLSQADPNDDIMFVGSSLKTLIFDDQYADLRSVISARAEKMRFLITHPCVGDLRARQENRAPGDIPREIMSTVNRLVVLQVPLTNIRLYLGTPTCFGIKTRKAMLLNPYPYRAEAPTSTTFIVRKSGYIYEQFSRQHFSAYDTAMATPIDQEYVKALNDHNLHAFARNADQLLRAAERDKLIAPGP